MSRLRLESEPCRFAFETTLVVVLTVYQYDLRVGLQDVEPIACVRTTRRRERTEPRQQAGLASSSNGCCLMKIRGRSERGSLVTSVARATTFKVDVTAAKNRAASG
jgi:hypothetical protein